MVGGRRDLTPASRPLNTRTHMHASTACDVINKCDKRRHGGCSSICRGLQPNHYTGEEEEDPGKEEVVTDFPDLGFLRLRDSVVAFLEISQWGRCCCKCAKACKSMYITQADPGCELWTVGDNVGSVNGASSIGNNIQPSMGC